MVQTEMPSLAQYSRPHTWQLQPGRFDSTFRNGFALGFALGLNLSERTEPSICIRNTNHLAQFALGFLPFALGFALGLSSKCREKLPFKGAKCLAYQGQPRWAANLKCSNKCGQLFALLIK